MRRVDGKRLSLTNSFRTGSCGTSRLSAKRHAGCRKNFVIGKNPYHGLKSWVCGHILVHDYFAVDTDIVWDVIERDLPDLKVKVEALLQQLERGS